MVVLDHRLGRQRSDRRRLGLLRRALRQQGREHDWSIVIALVGLWIPAAVNLTGVRNMGVFQVWTTVLKFIPLALMATVGLFFIDAANFTPWNTSGDTTCPRSAARWRSACSATSASRRLPSPPPRCATRSATCPSATIYGTLASAVVYLLSLIAVFGILPASALAQDSNKASYSSAANDDRRWHLVGQPGRALVIVSGIGALNGWTMICAEMPLAAAKDGLFPKRFAHESSRGVPAFGIIASTALASVAVRDQLRGTNGATVFTTLVLMTGITAAMPYAFSALAQLKWRFRDRHGHQHRAPGP